MRDITLILPFLLIFQLNQAGNSLRVDKSDNHRTTSRCRWKHSFQIAACCFRNFDVWSSTNKFRYKSRWGSTGKTFHFYGIRFAFKPFTSFIFHQSCWEYFDTKIWASKFCKKKIFLKIFSTGCLASGCIFWNGLEWKKMKT